MSKTPHAATVATAAEIIATAALINSLSSVIVIVIKVEVPFCVTGTGFGAAAAAAAAAGPLIRTHGSNCKNFTHMAAAAMVAAVLHAALERLV